MDLLSDIAPTMQAQAAHSWVVGGDWNCEPEELGATGFPNDVRGILVAPPERTCRSAAGDYRVLDYFMVSAGLANRLCRAAVPPGAFAHPHVPVQLTAPSHRDVFALQMTGPARLANTRIVGPLQKPLAVSLELRRAVAIATAAAENLGNQCGTIGEVHRATTRAYILWVRAARREVARMTGEEQPIKDAKVLFSWKPIAAQDRSPAFREDDASGPERWALQMIIQLAAIIEVTCPTLRADKWTSLGATTSMGLPKQMQTTEARVHLEVLDEWVSATACGVMPADRAADFSRVVAVAEGQLAAPQRQHALALTASWK